MKRSFGGIYCCFTVVKETILNILKAGFVDLTFRPLQVNSFEIWPNNYIMGSTYESTCRLRPTRIMVKNE